MCFLYYRIWVETKKRQKDLPNLQAGKKDNSKRSNSSDEANNTCATVDLDDSWRRPSSTGNDNDSVYMPSSISIQGDSARSSRHNRPPVRFTLTQLLLGQLVLNSCFVTVVLVQQVGGWGVSRVKAWCVAWWHSGREDSDTEEDTPSEQNLGYATPVSIETPLQSSVSRCTSLNVIRDPYQVPQSGQPNVTPTRLLAGQAPRDSRSLPSRADRLGPRSVSSDSVYTILIRLPEPAPLGDQQATIKMIPADRNLHGLMPCSDDGSLPNHHQHHAAGSMGRRPSAMPIPLNAKIIPKQLAGNKQLTGAARAQAKKKKKPQEKKADKKAAKTLSAILLTFIVTWTPYNILVLLKPVTGSSTRIPPQLWDFFYYLCYINSTINPMCYALCNASFRRTYLRILQCKWHNRNRAAMNRGYYN